MGVKSIFIALPIQLKLEGKKRNRLSDYPWTVLNNGWTNHCSGHPAVSSCPMSFSGISGIITISLHLSLVASVTFLPGWHIFSNIPTITFLFCTSGGVSNPSFCSSFFSYNAFHEHYTKLICQAWKSTDGDGHRNELPSAHAHLQKTYRYMDTNNQHG